MIKEIYTVQISNARAAHAEGLTVYDITVKTGDPIFAPTWQMVMDYKSGKLSEAAYESEYREMMHNSMRRFPHRWDHLMEHERLALACYCRPGRFCHRQILKEMLIEREGRKGEEVLDMGEVT